MPTHRIYSQLTRDMYGVFKLMSAGLARPHVANTMSGDMLGPFRCDYICTTLRTVTTYYSTHGQVPPNKPYLKFRVATRCDARHTKNLDN